MNKPLRIAMVAACPFPANYGTPGAIREMSVILADRGHQVFLCTYPYGHHLPTGELKMRRVKGSLSSSEVKIGPTKEKPWLDWKLLLKTIEVIRKDKVDLIHAHNYEGALVGIVASIFTGKPLVYHAINSMKDELQSYNFIKPAFLAKWLACALDFWVPKFPDHIIALSERIKDNLLFEGVPDRKLTFIPAGVSLSLFSDPKPYRIKQKYHLGDERIVLYTGGTQGYQRIDYLMKAFQVARKHIKGIRLAIVMPIDEDTQKWRSYASELGIADDVIWMGPHKLEDLPDYIAIADVAVVSRPDTPGHPIKLLNYMASQVPAVCFKGSAKGLRHKTEAWVVEDHDHQALGQGIVELLTDKALAQTLTKNAYQLLLQKFTWEALCNDVEAVYHEVLAVKG